jgi:hypothetical protein
MKNLIAELAKSMGVSESDVLCLAQSVANSLKKDGVDKIESELSDADKTAVTIAYVPHAVKKFESFVSVSKTNQAARATLEKTVLNLI